MYYLITMRIVRLIQFGVVICLLLSATHLTAQSYSKTTISQLELEHLTGLYTGQLQYKDYSDGQITTIKLLGNVYYKNDALVMETIINERGKIYRNSMKFKIKKGQVHYGGKTQLLSKEIDYEAQVMEFTLGRKGKDNKKTVDLKFEFVAGLNNITLSKWVKPNGEKEYFKRNEYSFDRY